MRNKKRQAAAVPKKIGKRRPELFLAPVVAIVVDVSKLSEEQATMVTLERGPDGLRVFNG